MAVDKSYGSGKSRSAANSAARRTRAASAGLRKANIQKVASKPFQRQAVASVGKQAAAGFNINGRQYLETGISPNKLLSAAKALFSSGQASKAAALEARAAARVIGKKVSSSIDFYGRNFDNGRLPVNSRVESRMANAANRRIQSESVFPRAPKKGPMGQPDLGDLGAGRVGLPFNTPAQIRRTNRARRATQAGDRVYELEKRLNLPGKAPKRGR